MESLLEKNVIGQKEAVTAIRYSCLSDMTKYQNSYFVPAMLSACLALGCTHTTDLWEASCFSDPRVSAKPNYVNNSRCFCSTVRRQWCA